MPDPNPDQIVQQLRAYVAAVQELIDQYERAQQPPSQPEPATDRARRRWGLPLAVAVGVGLWLRERYAASVAAAGAATVMVAVGWLASQGPTDVPGAAPTATVTRFPSATTATPGNVGSSVPPSDRQVSPPREDHEVEEEDAADRPAPTTPPPVDDEPDLTPPPPDATTPPPGDSGDGVEEVVQRRCLTVKVLDLPVRVCGQR